MKDVSDLIKGAIDLHVHSGPGLVISGVDHVEAAKQCLDAGMKGLVLKDQHCTTCNLTYFLSKYIFKDAPISIYGGLVLNNNSGGFDPNVVDTAIGYGAKIIWMPTLSAKNHLEFYSY